MKQRGRADPWVLAFLCFFFVFSSGRIASQDVGQQLQAAVLLTVSGGLGDEGGGSGPADASWVRAPNGRLYQAHDIGNIYNFVRTGSPIRPATATDQYLHGVQRVDRQRATRALRALPVGQSRSLPVSPILLLVFVAAIRAQALARDQRQLLAVYGAGAAGYTLLISKMANWGAFGWGPRYLLPVLPVLFFGAACGAMSLWRIARPAVLALAILSAVLTVPPAVVNWHLATTSFEGADTSGSPTPRQQRAGWTALAWGLRGRPLPLPPNASGDALRATTSEFPDLFLWRLAAVSRAGTVAALLGGAAATLLAVVSARKILGAET